MKAEEAGLILEEVLDTLVEVGNGISYSDLKEAADKLFRFRDEWFDPKPAKICRLRMVGAGLSGAHCDLEFGHEGPHQHGTREGGGFVQWSDELCEGRIEQKQ